MIIGNMSEEANKAANVMMNSKATIFDLNGGNYRRAGREAAQAAYMMTRPSTSENKHVSKEDAEKILNLKYDEITIDVIGEYLLTFDKAAKYEWNDILVVTNVAFPNDKSIKRSITTTIGKYFFNKVIAGDVEWEFMNDRVTNGMLDDRLGELGTKVIDDQLDMNDFLELIDRAEDFRYRLSGLVNVSYSDSVLVLKPKTKAMRDKLVADNLEELEKGNIPLYKEITKKVIDQWKEDYKGDPSVDMFMSGDKPNIAANITPSLMGLGYKPNMNGEIVFIKNGYSDGLTKKESITNAEVAVIGARARAVDTAIGNELPYYVVTHSFLSLTNCWDVLKVK